MKIVERVVNFEDSRGIIVDLVENRNINAVTFISFTKGSVRANHYHKKTIQWNYLLKGQVKILAQFGSEPVQERVLVPGDLVYTEPMEKHALIGIEDSELLVFTEGPRGGKDYESDTFKLETPLA
jgi:quercetin dioxygenase-like cupin family protein